MTTYKGETLTPKLASEEETETVQRLLNLKEQAKDLYSEMDELIQRLPQGVPLVANVNEKQEDGSLKPLTKTFVVDKPTGHYVTYRELDLTMNAKTTKKDLKEVGLE